MASTRWIPEMSQTLVQGKGSEKQSTCKAGRTQGRTRREREMTFRMNVVLRRRMRTRVHHTIHPCVRTKRSWCRGAAHLVGSGYKHRWSRVCTGPAHEGPPNNSTFKSCKGAGRMDDRKMEQCLLHTFIPCPRVNFHSTYYGRGGKLRIKIPLLFSFLPTFTLNLGLTIPIYSSRT